MRALIWLCCLLILAAVPLAAQAQMEFPLVRGYEHDAPETGSGVVIDPQTPLGLELAGAVQDPVNWIGGWELVQGMWREFLIDGDPSGPQWLTELVRREAGVAAPPENHTPYGNQGCRVYVALGLLPSVRNPEVQRTWVYSYFRDAAGKLSLVNRYEVHPGEFDLDEEIDGVYCSKAFCLEFFGDGELALVLPWSYRQLGYYETTMVGVDVVRINDMGAMQPYDEELDLNRNTAIDEIWTVSDLNHDGQWEIQYRMEFIPGGYYGRYLFRPNWRGDWTLQYDPQDPFYKEQADFYRTFQAELLSAAANLHQPKYSGKDLSDENYGITIGDTYYEIDDLVKDRNVLLGSVVNFEQTLLYLQRLLLRGNG